MEDEDRVDYSLSHKPKPVQHNFQHKKLTVNVISSSQKSHKNSTGESIQDATKRVKDRPAVMTLGLVKVLCPWQLQIIASNSS